MPTLYWIKKSPPQSLKRDKTLHHHIVEGSSWLRASDNGTNTVPLSYAAFEFRLAIERIGLQYLYYVEANEGEFAELNKIRTFNKIEQRLYKLAGHQQQIDRSFEFGKTLLSLLKIPLTNLLISWVTHTATLPVKNYEHISRLSIRVIACWKRIDLTA